MNAVQPWRSDAIDWRERRRSTIMTSSSDGIIFWHRDLPPLDAEPVEEHTLEATSARVPGTIAHRDDLWDQCYRDLMVSTRTRLEQELHRLRGHYAHVLEESIDTRHDPITDEAWLHGRFRYTLYRRSGRS